MRSDPTLLAFDTSAAHCAAALLMGGGIFGETVLPMTRGQAEALMPLLERTLAAKDIGWSDLDALAVGIGPGNFTGIRIAVSAARGLALALERPAVGVSMFEVMACCATSESTADRLVSLPAPRDMAYVQTLHHGSPHGGPWLIDPEAPPPDLPVRAGISVIGHRATEIARHFDATPVPTQITDLSRRIALIAQRRLTLEKEEPARPAPLYVRPADAAPPADPPPVILP